MKRWLILLMSGLLAACGKPVGNEREATPATNGQGYLARINGLPEGQVRGVLYRAIIDGGAQCTQVTAAAREADQNGRAVWSAQCANAGRWLVSIGDDGVAQARPIGKER